MKHSYTRFLLSFFFLFYHAHSKAQTYEWVKGGGSGDFIATSVYGVEATHKMCTDPHGNVYALNVVGRMPIYADTFYHVGGSWSPNSILFTSHDCHGQMRFAKLITASSPYGQGIVADSFGNIYMAADLPHNFSGPTVLRMGYDTTITGHNYSHQALVKYDTSGDFKWIRFVGDNTLISSNGTGGGGNYLKLDGAQNPHLILNNYAGIVFRPGDTSKYGATDLRYDGAGNLITVKHLNFDTTLALAEAAIDPQSNKLYAYGERSGLFPSLSAYKFLVAFDTNRNLIWIDTLNNPGSISYGFTGVAAGGYGHLYVSAQGAGGTTIFKNDTAKNVLSTSAAAILNFVMKTDTSGNVKWLTTLSATSGAGLVKVVLSPDKRKLAVAGSILGKVKCDIDSTVSYSGEAKNPIFSVLDTAGYIQEIQQLHGSGANDWANVIMFDRVGSAYIGGRDDATIWGGAITPYTSVGGDSDYFIMKYGVDCNCPAVPASNFTYTLSGTSTVGFTYTGSTSPAIDSVRWYFGDGSPISTSMTPTHVYTSSGTFTVRCWVYTNCGRDMKAIKVVIPCTYPGGASFTHSGVYSIAFNYTGSTMSVDSVRWNFGDGGTSPLVNPTHAYGTTGSYNVCVKVYSWCMVDSFCTTITVPCITAPTAALSTSGTGATRSFTYTGTTTGVTSISWDYGDGSGTGSGTSTSHTYGAIGIYTVCVTATSPCGSNIICTTVNVTCLSTPTASYSKAGSMSVRSFGYVGSPVGIDSVVWDFGDGGHATGTSPSHTYVATGVFTVCVTAYSQCGNSTWCDTVNIPCLAIPSVTFTNTGSIHDSTKGFTYTGSLTGIDSVRWDFGDGTDSIGTSVTHSYSDTGSYTVCAIAYSQCGNITFCSTVIYRLPVGVAAVAAGSVLVYPNPANDKLVVENAEGYSLTINDLVSREVLYVPILSQRMALDINTLPTGVFVVQLRCWNKETFTFKLLKQ